MSLFHTILSLDLSFGMEEGGGARDLEFGLELGTVRVCVEAYEDDLKHDMKVTSKTTIIFWFRPKSDNRGILKISIIYYQIM